MVAFSPRIWFTCAQFAFLFYLFLFKFAWIHFYHERCLADSRRREIVLLNLNTFLGISFFEMISFFLFTGCSHHSTRAFLFRRGKLQLSLRWWLDSSWRSGSIFSFFLISFIVWFVVVCQQCCGYFLFFWFTLLFCRGSVWGNSCFFLFFFRIEMWRLSSVWKNSWWDIFLSHSLHEYNHWCRCRIIEFNSWKIFIAPANRTTTGACPSWYSWASNRSFVFPSIFWSWIHGSLFPHLSIFYHSNVCSGEIFETIQWNTVLAISNMYFFCNIISHQGRATQCRSTWFRCWRGIKWNWSSHRSLEVEDIFFFDPFSSFSFVNLFFSALWTELENLESDSRICNFYRVLLELCFSSWMILFSYPRSRICSALDYWVKRHFSDFKQDTSLLRALQNFIDIGIAAAGMENVCPMVILVGKENMYIYVENWISISIATYVSSPSWCLYIPISWLIEALPSCGS